MRKTLLINLCLIATMAMAQEQRESKPVIIPGKGGIDVEQLNKRVDLSQDISRLNVAEVRILRNSFYAREGYVFGDAFLRGVYQNTSWYSQKMWERWELQEESRAPEITLTKEEQDFVAKLNAREKELLQENFRPQTAGWRVNMDNVVNAMQLEQFDPKLRNKLGKNGFAIVPAKHEQLFHLYEQNDYCNFPNFVTTDLYLQLYHMYFDCILREVEEQKFSKAVDRLCERGILLTKAANTPEMQRLRSEAFVLLDGLHDSAVAEALKLYLDYVVQRTV